jgi:hypothetical protein
VNDTIPLQQGDSATSFMVIGVIKNNSAQSLYYGGWCGFSAELNVGGAWKRVWSPICVNPGGVAVLPPHDSVAFSVKPYGFTSPGTYPQVNPLMSAGLYRLTTLMGFKDSSDQNPALPGLHERGSTPLLVRASDGR